jgi:hypothetical protein
LHQTADIIGFILQTFEVQTHKGGPVDVYILLGSLGNVLFMFVVAPVFGLRFA